MVFLLTVCDLKTHSPHRQHASTKQYNGNTTKVEGPSTMENSQIATHNSSCVNHFRADGPIQHLILASVLLHSDHLRPDHVPATGNPPALQPYHLPRSSVQASIIPNSRPQWQSTLYPHILRPRAQLPTPAAPRQHPSTIKCGKQCH
jgi:hypothetical protein